MTTCVHMYSIMVVESEPYTDPQRLKFEIACDKCGRIEGWEIPAKRIWFYQPTPLTKDKK